MKTILCKATIIILFCVFGAGCSTRSIQEAEKQYLVTIADLQQYGVELNHKASGESFEVTKFFDSSQEIEYEYDSDNDPKNKLSLYLSSCVEIHNSERAAKDAFKNTIAGYKLGTFITPNGVDIKAAENLFTLGDDNYSAYYVSNGNKGGNIISTRKDKVVYSFILSGLYFDDKESLHELIAPKLNKVINSKK